MPLSAAKAAQSRWVNRLAIPPDPAASLLLGRAAALSGGSGSRCFVKGVYTFLTGN